MKIELNHTIMLQSGYAFLEIEVLHNASDMAAFLESLQKNEVYFEEPLQTRAKREMQNLGFLDSNNSLTKKGKKLIETKQRYIKECGKYKIDFSLDDDIFDNRIFKAKRAEIDESEQELETIDFGKKSYLLLDDKNKRLDKIITTTAKIQKNGTTQSHITYQRFYEIDSKGNVIQDKEELNGIAIEADENFLDTQSFIQKYEQALGSNWDREKSAYKVDKNELNEFLEEQVIKDIRTLTANCEVEEDFTIHNLALSPKEESDAKYILTLCLLKDLSESYLTQDDLDSKLESYINHKGLNEFLQTANKKEYIKDLESSLKQEKDKTAFWHYYAINDLLPKRDLLPNIIKTITLNNNEELSYADFIDKIAQNREIQAFIYIDRYFINEYQYKKAELITQGFNTQQYLIITDERNIEFLTARQLNARPFDPIPHDRYMILKVNNEIEIWNITQSDFLRFEEIKTQDITLDTKGRAEGCVISNIGNFSIFDNKLKEIIQDFMGEQ
ncbi:hypothetical protein [Helicobacter canis]|uniref:Uncharacterized protein n=1 Tax=Helicobacter canis TaxID=29419 RepID=A0A377J8C0_9HELI|nr:hypothetical protein [Helicobacter canis]STO98066.1 Uncharacterised protein [Helicobacter canis]